MSVCVCVYSECMRCSYTHIELMWLEKCPIHYICYILFDKLYELFVYNAKDNKLTQFTQKNSPRSQVDTYTHTHTLAIHQLRILNQSSISLAYALARTHTHAAHTNP